MSDLVALIIIGIISGTAAGSVMSGRSKRNFSDLLRDTAIGIIGAIVGTFLFSALSIDLPEFLNASVSLAELLIAFIGAILVIFVARLIRR